MHRIATGLFAVLGAAGLASAAGAGLLGDSVTAHVSEVSAHDDFTQTTATVGVGIEFLAETFNPSVLFSLDMTDTGFVLAYESTLASDFNEGITQLAITDLDFTPPNPITGVHVVSSDWPAGSFDGLSFGPDSITFDLTNISTDIPGMTTWTATFAIDAPEPDAGAGELAVLGALLALARHFRSSSVWSKARSASRRGARGPISCHARAH